MIDRLLKLPASLFHEYTVGDFLDRSMGVDTARRIFTGRALRGMMTGPFCWFSIIGLMLYYDLKLGLVATALVIFRALLIIATSAMSLYHETKHFSLEGKIGGFSCRRSQRQVRRCSIRKNLSLQVSRFVLGGPFPTMGGRRHRGCSSLLLGSRWSTKLTFRYKRGGQPRRRTRGALTYTYPLRRQAAAGRIPG